MAAWQERRSEWLDTLSPDNFWVQQAGNNWGYQHPSTIEPTPDPAAEAQNTFNSWIWNNEAPAEWWRTPGLTPEHLTALEGAGYNAPDYAFFEGSGYHTPSDFYQAFQSVADIGNPAVTEAFLTDLRARADREAGRQEAIEELTGARQGLQGAFEAWEADPYRTATMDMLLERSQPGYSIVTPQQEAETEWGIARQNATARALAEASAAGRGVLGGGAHGSRMDAIGAYARGAGLSADARIAQANAQAQERALGAMGAMAGNYEQIDQTYRDAMTRADAALAELDLGIEPTDAAVWPTLDLAFEELERQTGIMTQALSDYDEAQQKDWQDVAMFLADLGDTGLYKWLNNLIAMGMTGFG